MRGTKCLVWIVGTCLVEIVSAQNEPHGCNYTHCIDTRISDFKSVISCGKVVSEDPVNGIKCAHVTLQRDRYSIISDICKSLQMYNMDTNETIQTGNLITINSIAENNKTRDHFMNVTQVPGSTSVYYPYGYIGLRRDCRDCNFYWNDHEPLTFTNWYSTEPNTPTYDCAWMRMTSPYFGKWTDWYCSLQYNGICQFFPQGAPKTLKPDLPRQGGCKAGWWAFGGYCYKEFGLRIDDGGAMDTSGFKTYFEGNQTCNDEWTGARMAIMPSIEHNSMIASLLGPSFFGSDVWVGIYNWATYDYSFSLDNQKRLLYDRWVYGKPYHMQGNVDKCGSMKWRTEQNYYGTTRLSEWENRHCTNNRLPFMCSHEQSDEFPVSNYRYPTVYSLPLVNCADGWIPYHSACYKFFSEEKSFYEANDFCKDQSPPGALMTNLLSLWDEYEMQFGRTFLRDDALPNRDPEDLPDGFWIGLEYIDSRDNPTSPWDSPWRWVDNWPLTRSNWAGNHPNSQVYGKCGFMNNKGQYESVECYQKKPFVCKAEFYEFTDDWDNGSLGEPVGCSEGWMLVGLHCLKLFVDPLPFSEARNDCKLRGSNLVSIHSPNYNALVTDIYNNATSDARGMWIGLTWKGANLGWQWEDSSELSYTNWDNGEPNDWGGVAEDCVELHQSGFWNDNPCSTAFPYMCKAIVETEFCALAKTTVLKPCGFVGVSEEECMFEWNCCYDPTTEVAPGQHCFKPASPVDVGMAAGLAVGITLLVIALAIATYCILTKYGNPFSSGTSAVNNPMFN